MVDDQNDGRTEMKTAGAAVAALVLGLLSLIFGLLTGIPAIICGIIAISSITANPQTRKGMGMAIAGLIIGILGTVVVTFALLMVAMLFPALGRARGQARKTQCRSHLRGIGLAITMYANDSGGWSPSIAPEARKLANAAGVPGGCVVAYEDSQGAWHATGLGLLYQGGYVRHKGPEKLFSPSIDGDDRAWVDAFTLDEDDSFWAMGTPGPPNGDGVGELPGNPRVMLTNYVLRCNTENPWGSVKLSSSFGDAIVSSIVPVVPGGVASHGEDSYNVLFTDGSVKVFSDASQIVRDTCAAAGDDIEKVLDKDVFGTYFDALH